MTAPTDHPTPDPRIAEWGYADLDELLKAHEGLLENATAFDGLGKPQPSPGVGEAVERSIASSDKLMAMYERARQAEARIANLEAERKADGAKGWPVHICEVRNASDFEQERAAVRASQTYRSGDVVRVWACEGDIFANPNVKLEVIDAAHQKGGE